MAAFAAYPTLIPTFQNQWGLTNTEVGWIGGIYFGGYIVAVGLLTALTDRVDPKPVYLCSMVISLGSAVGFGLAAHDVTSASLWRCLQGIGLAGTYMPGLKALTDLTPPHLHGRSVAFYTASFGVGASLSIFLSGSLEPAIGWQDTFFVCALGPLAACIVTAWILPANSGRIERPLTGVLDFRPILANRRALGFTLAYAAHNAELFGFRTWIVAFLVFSQSLQTPETLGVALSAATLAAIVNLVGLPASVITNEFAAKFGRVITLTVVMTGSGLFAIVLGFSSSAPYWLMLVILVVYGFLVTADSATITAGVVEVADPQYRGTTMALHSLLGFTGSFIGPIIFGVVLDIAGGEGVQHAWGVAFTAMAIIVMLGPIVVSLMCRTRAPDCS